MSSILRSRRFDVGVLGERHDAHLVAVLPPHQQRVALPAHDGAFDLGVLAGGIGHVRHERIACRRGCRILRGDGGRDREQGQYREMAGECCRTRTGVPQSVFCRVAHTSHYLSVGEAADATTFASILLYRTAR